MAVDEEKNNPPLWLIVLGIIVVSVAAVFVMLMPTHEYTQPDQYYLKDAQSQVIYQSHKAAEPFLPVLKQDNRVS